MWRRIGARVPVAVWRRVVGVLVLVAVLVAFLLLWECLELEGGAARAVGELRVRADEELADAVVSYALL